MCIEPTTVWVRSGPGWEQIARPCRKCWRCNSNRVNDYVGRSLCEAATSDATCALTLTYAPRDDLADQVITPPHFQAFIRALRDSHHLVRYLVAGEYGERKGRAHFHALLFFKSGPKNPIPTWVAQKNIHIDQWPHGHVFADWGGGEASARYVCKYLLKDEPEKRWFSLSKKPALGADWFQEKAQTLVEAQLWPSTFEYLPPGGSKGRSYLMTGATRREFIRALLEGMAHQMGYRKQRLSEWVAIGTKKVELWQVRKDDVHVDLESFMAALKDDLDMRRPSEAQIANVLGMEDIANSDTEYWNRQYLEVGRWLNEVEIAEARGVPCPPFPNGGMLVPLSDHVLQVLNRHQTAIPSQSRGRSSRPEVTWYGTPEDREAFRQSMRATAKLTTPFRRKVDRRGPKEW